MTKLDEERVSKKRKGIENEIIDELGQDSEKKAVPVVKEYLDTKEKEAQKREDDRLELLEEAPKSFKTYPLLLSELLKNRLRFVDWPKGWTYETGTDGVGVIMEIYGPNGRIFRTAFKPTGEAKYDLNAINVYGLRAENTIDRISKEPITKSA